MKIVVADRIADAGIELFRKQPGFEVVVAWEVMPDWNPKKNPNQVVSLLAQTNPVALAVRSDTQVTADVLVAAPALKVIGRAGVGVDNIDLNAATERGVIVMNTPDGNTIATAELTFTHILCCARPICRADAETKAGGFPRKTLPTGLELRGKTLGICGLGRIGTEVARRAQAFAMNVIAYDPFVTLERARSLGVERVELDDIYARSDFITFHVPKPKGYMVDAAAIARMKTGVRLVNVARGGIIDENALAQALKTGKVAWAGLDVFEEEPLPASSPLRGLANVNLTPHLGASTVEAQENVGIEVAEQMVEALSGGMVRNAVNMPSVDPKVLETLRPYLHLGEKLGTFIQQLGLGDECAERIEISFYGKIIQMDVNPLSRAIQRGYLRHISPNVNDVNAPRKLEQLGLKVEVTKSTADAEYTELIRVRIVASSGKTRTVAGTLFGPQNNPRIVEIDTHALEINTQGTLLVLKNSDVPGIVGFIGTTLGQDNVNIANLSLSRDKGEGFAVSVYEIDSVPSEAAQQAIIAHKGILKFKVIQL